MPGAAARGTSVSVYRRVLVVCPGGAVTGGPEALHQLVDAMRSAGQAAFMVYWPTDRRFEIPPPYAQYDAPQAAFEDRAGDLIVFPEVMPSEALKVREAEAALWWLSLDNFLCRKNVSRLRDWSQYWKRALRGQRPWDGAKSLHRLRHLSQTEHATAYLRSCGIEPEPLIDYINVRHFVDQTPELIAGKRKRILYNPTKGKAFVDRLRAARPDWEFQPLRGLDRDQLSELLDASRLYVDFGHHPGRDRLPREAASHGCCIVSGRLGSAGNDIDLPIPQMYKLDTRAGEFVQRACSLIEDMLDDFATHHRAFEPYRNWVRAEPALFSRQVRDVLATRAPRRAVPASPAPAAR